MKNAILLSLAVIISLCCVDRGMAQLNDVKVGSCQSKALIDGWIAAEEAKGLVMDSRPFAINQSKGKLLFPRGSGRVSVIHMNPFVYNYKISVAQQELVSTALTDFLKLILPPSLATLPTTQSGEAGKRVDASAPSKLAELESRLMSICPTATKPEDIAQCACPAGTDPIACSATMEMFRVYLKIAPLLASGSTIVVRLDNSEIRNKTGGRIDSTDAIYVSFTGNMGDLRNEQLS